MERRIILETPGEKNNTCIQLLYEANGAHEYFPRRYRLWPRLEKILGRVSQRVSSLAREQGGYWEGAFLESIIFG